jgi:hypothetical protein
VGRAAAILPDGGHPLAMLQFVDLIPVQKWGAIVPPPLRISYLNHACAVWSLAGQADRCLAAIEVAKEIAARELAIVPVSHVLEVPEGQFYFGRGENLKAYSIVRTAYDRAKSSNPKVKASLLEALIQINIAMAAHNEVDQNITTLRIMAAKTKDATVWEKNLGYILDIQKFREKGEFKKALDTIALVQEKTSKEYRGGPVRIGLRLGIEKLFSLALSGDVAAAKTLAGEIKSAFLKKAPFTPQDGFTVEAVAKALNGESFEASLEGVRKILGEYNAYVTNLETILRKIKEEVDKKPANP